jgi:hypothetical protein
VILKIRGKIPKNLAKVVEFILRKPKNPKFHNSFGCSTENKIKSSKQKHW